MEAAENLHPDPASEHRETSRNPNPMEISPTLGWNGLIDRIQFIRIIIQALYSLGFKKTASSLESESGVQLDSPEYKSLISQINSGRWEDCIATINRIDHLAEGTRSMASFLIWREHFFELLRSSDGMLSALDVLRKNISPLGVDRWRVHRLTCRLISLEGIALYNVNQQRTSLLMELAGLLPTCLQVPSRRLEHLVEMAVLKQRASCTFHNFSDVISLYGDHLCSPDQIPSKTVQILSDHENEVWFVQFSNKGEHLASSSRDCTAIIWTVNEDDTVSFKHTLEGHKSPVFFVAWSPDDTMLLTCGNEEVLKLWDVDTGTCKHTFGGGEGRIISSCAWFPDSRKVVCGSCEPESCIFMCDLQGKELKAWKEGRMAKVSNLAVTPDGQHLISVLADKVIRIYDFEKGIGLVVPEEHTITSLSLSCDGRFLIVNLNSEEIHLWDLDGDMIEPWRYTGHKQKKYVIRSCFGGLDCSFIASGSEDSQVYIWQRAHPFVIQILSGHSMTVNCVSWNPTKPQMLASASDDRTIRIWLASRKPNRIST